VKAPLIALIIFLFSSSVLVIPATSYVQGYTPFFHLEPIEEEPTDTTSTSHLVTSTNSATSVISEKVTVSYHAPFDEQFNCPISEDEDARDEKPIHIRTYTDSANNTIKIYCQYNPWLPDIRLKQYIAFYNDFTVVGLCPYDEGVNRHEIHTTDDDRELINRFHWLSVKPDGSDYVVFNTYFDGINRAI
jgi:hypothetical protein